MNPLKPLQKYSPRTGYRHNTACQLYLFFDDFFQISTTLVNLQPRMRQDNLLSPGVISAADIVLAVGPLFTTTPVLTAVVLPTLIAFGIRIVVQRFRIFFVESSLNVCTGVARPGNENVDIQRQSRREVLQDA